MNKKIKIDSNIVRLLIILLVFILLDCVTKPTQFLKIANFQTMA